MKIHSLTLRPLEIAFKAAFKHSSAERKRTESVMVRAVTADGAVGFGEGCPRGYVTGEDVDSCLDFFERHRQTLLDRIQGVSDLEEWARSHAAEIDRHPAAWCAIELALLDALSKQAGRSVEKALGLPELRGVFAYTAVLGDSERAVFESQVARFAQVGFSDFKLKITGDVAVDAVKCGFVVDTVPGARVRLDANNLWHTASEVGAYLDALHFERTERTGHIEHSEHLAPFTPFALEEPLQAMDFKGMGEWVRRSPVPLILDESFLNASHFEAALRLEGKAIVNIRISKMGGLIRSLAIAECARAEGIPIILGAHVGETSILTRAALVVAGAFPSGILAQEGAFGTHLLESDVTPRPLMFGKGGRLDTATALSPEKDGFQLEYRPDIGDGTPG